MQSIQLVLTQVKETAFWRVMFKSKQHTWEGPNSINVKIDICFNLGLTVLHNLEHSLHAIIGGN